MQNRRCCSEGKYKVDANRSSQPMTYFPAARLHSIRIQTRPTTLIHDRFLASLAAYMTLYIQIVTSKRVIYLRHRRKKRTAVCDEIRTLRRVDKNNVRMRINKDISIIAAGFFRFESKLISNSDAMQRVAKRDKALQSLRHVRKKELFMKQKRGVLDVKNGAHT
jgi:hypothetical protein